MILVKKQKNPLTHTNYGGRGAIILIKNKNKKTYPCKMWGRGMQPPPSWLCWAHSYHHPCPHFHLPVVGGQHLAVSHCHCPWWSPSLPQFCSCPSLHPSPLCEQSLMVVAVGAGLCWLCCSHHCCCCYLPLCCQCWCHPMVFLGWLPFLFVTAAHGPHHCLRLHVPTSFSLLLSWSIIHPASRCSQQWHVGGWVGVLSWCHLNRT